MSTQLTERDKKLLWLMAWFLIVVGIYWFAIKPIMADISELDTQIELLDYEADSVRMQLVQLEGLQAQLEEANAGAALAGESFYDSMDSGEIDRMFTSMILAKDLTPTNLQISIQRDTASMKPYLYSQRYRDKDAEENTELADTLTGLHSAQVTLSCTGTQAQAQSLLDDLFNAQQSLLVTSFSWSQKAGDDEKAATASLQLTLLLYMKQPA